MSPCSVGKPTEYVKYGTITFDTTAILHHYPQNSSENKPQVHLERVAVKKTDLNLGLDEIQVENNNGIKPKSKECADNVTNNNRSVDADEAKNSAKDNSGKPIKLNKIKFVEEKLV